MSFIVEGIKTRDANKKPYVRQDIDKWYAEQVKGDRIQLTLFVEALALIQARPMDNLLSYFRLAGIHAAPWCKWDGVPQPDRKATDADSIQGYCVHNNYTFPTWHRVYMMLYERALFDAMHEWIGKSVPGNLQEKWKKEADAWRLPYWDFARLADRPAPTPGIENSDIDHDKLRLPILCMMPNVRIIAYPGGRDLKSRPNPLYKYESSELMGNLPHPYTIKGEGIPEKRKPDKDHPDDWTKDTVKSPPFTYPWDKCNATTKYGILQGFDKDIWADGGQNWLRANYALNEHPWYNSSDLSESPVPTLQDLVFRLFQHGLDNWASFSSTLHEPKPNEDETKGNAKNAINIEFIHNNLHNWVGGTQFLRPPKEGIHLWGSGHMSSVNMAAFDPIFFIYHNNIDRLTAIWQSLNSKLWFDDDCSKRTQNDDLLPFHRTNDKFWRSDDVKDWRALGYDYPILKGREDNSDENRKAILDDINALYGQPTKTFYGNHPGGEEHDDDFVITVIYDKYALNGAPYKINIFLDGADNFRGPESEGFVASIYNFSGSLDSGNCGNCKTQKEAGVKCIAQVPATVSIRHRLKKMATMKKVGTKDLKDDAPKPLYLALNGLGVPVPMDDSIQIKLHRSRREYYRNPFAPVPGDPLTYEPIKDGGQANDAFNDPAFQGPAS